VTSNSWNAGSVAAGFAPLLVSPPASRASKPLRLKAWRLAANGELRVFAVLSEAAGGRVRCVLRRPRFARPSPGARRRRGRAGRGARSSRPPRPRAPPRFARVPPL